MYMPHEVNILVFVLSFLRIPCTVSGPPRPHPTTCPCLSHGQVVAMTTTEARERGLIPEASEETLQAFSSSDMKPYKHATAYKWTVYELIKSAEAAA
jgi:hypothetical protein